MEPCHGYTQLFVLSEAGLRRVPHCWLTVVLLCGLLGRCPPKQRQEQCSCIWHVGQPTSTQCTSPATVTDSLLPEKETSLATSCQWIYISQNLASPALTTTTTHHNARHLASCQLCSRLNHGRRCEEATHNAWLLVTR